MKTHDAVRALFDHSVRVERMFWLPGLGQEPPQDFEDFCADYDPASFTGELPPYIAGYLKDDDFDQRERAEIVAETLSANATPGFLVQIATPVRQMLRGGSYMCSWGHYYTTWIYAETTDALVEKAVAWAEERHAPPKQPKKKKKAATQRRS